MRNRPRSMHNHLMITSYPVCYPGMTTTRTSGSYGRIMSRRKRRIARRAVRHIRGIGVTTRFDAVIVFAGLVLFAIAWPTLHVTHVVSPPAQPAIAALAAFPLLLIRVNPALGWAISAGSAQLIALGFAHTEGNVLPWQVVHILVFLPLLFAVALRAPLQLVGVAWVGSALLYAANMPDGVGWAIGLTALVVVGLLVRYLVLSRRRLAEQEEANELERARRAILEEKARIARDLHDIVAHHMSLVVVQAQSAPYRVANVSDEAKAEFESIGATARDALNEVRGMLGVLRSDGRLPDHAPQPGAADIGDLLAGTRKAGVPISWRIDGSTEPVPETTGLALYRILQESLSNASRHAPGAWVDVRIDYGTSLVDLTVANGPAASAPTPVGNGGHGLRGMQERALAVGGLVTAGPRDDGGFAVNAQLPVVVPAFA